MPGTLRTILVLVALWWILRFILRRNVDRSGGRTAQTTDQRRNDRPKGEVRIENIPNKDKDDRHGGGSVSDADYEVIK